MPRFAALLVTAALAAAGASEASAAYTIRTDEGVITRIGDLRTRSVAPTLARAMRVFGRPSAVDPVGDGSDGCRVRWRRLRLRATFANFGLGSACRPREGLLQGATIRSGEFRTARGLRVGDRSSTIKEKHPAAFFRRNTWWITVIESPFGETDELIPTIEAIVSDGRVKVLRLFVGAAGD